MDREPRQRRKKGRILGRHLQLDSPAATFVSRLRGARQKPAFFHPCRGFVIVILAYPRTHSFAVGWVLSPLSRMQIATANSLCRMELQNY